MDVNLVVSQLKCTPFKLQKLYLPKSTCFEESGRYATVRLTDSTSYICRVFHDELLPNDCCLLEKSVQTVPCEPRPSNLSGRIDRINFIPLVKPIRSARVTVVLSRIEDSQIWKDRSLSYLSLLKQLLQLFVVNTGCLINLANFEAAQKLGISMIFVDDIGILHTGRVTQNTKITMKELISWERYSMRLSSDDIEVAGNAKAYDHVRKFVECRGVLKDNKLAANYDFSQLMVIGPAGSGKKTLLRKVAKECNAVLTVLDCTRLMRPKPGDTETLIGATFEHSKLLASEGLVILLLTHLETVCSKPGRILNQINSMLDSISRLPNLVVVTTSSDPNSIHVSVKSASRFNNVVFLGVPSEDERLEMFKMLGSDDISLSEDHWCELARMTPGYVLADLALVINKTRRALSKWSHDYTAEEEMFSLIKTALSSVEPSAVRGELGLVKSNASILQIGGLRRIKEILLRSVQWPLFHAAAFKRMNINQSSGILLYGPPGCAKTSLARAVAAGSNVTFLAVSAADLYSPYVGDTERTISSLFQRARAAAPTLLFIDEIDALVGNRAGQQKHSQGRVLSSFLIEMDGLGVNAEAEFLRDASACEVIIVAATNRPHVIDTALLRPGRLDKLIYVPPPDLEDRVDILRVITESMPLEDGMDLVDIAEKTELYSGADLSNLCREAALHAMTTKGVDAEGISHADFLSALSHSRPSLLSSQVQWYKDFSFS